MSRDAKIGLVIVFAFVFLFGTILVHRLHSNTPVTADADDPAVIDDESPDSETEPSSTGGAPLAGARAATDSAVIDAVSDEEVPAPFGGRSTSRTGPGPASLPRPSGSAAGSKSSGEPSGHYTGSGQIVLSDPPAERRPAAVVESPGPAASDSGNRLDIASPTNDPRRVRDSIPAAPDPAIEMPHTRAGVESVVPSESETEPVAEAVDASEIAKDESPAPIPKTENSVLNRGSQVPPPGVLEFPDASRSSIQQAAGKRPQPASPDSAPTKLRNFPDAKPTIESVGDELTPPDTTTEPRSNIPPIAEESSVRSRSVPAPDDQFSGQKPYVVREGDSFWTISARFYGTGKYFRALEECNRDRLAAAGAEARPGDRQLVPGTTIVLPDVATLRSTTGAAQPTTAARATRRDPPAKPAKPEPVTGSRPVGSSAPDTYVVQEGDTLSTISQRVFGTSKRWEEIFQLNRDKLKNPNQVRAGMELKLPTGPPGEKIVDGPYPGR